MSTAHSTAPIPKAINTRFNTLTVLGISSPNPEYSPYRQRVQKVFCALLQDYSKTHSAVKARVYLPTGIKHAYSLDSLVKSLETA